MKIASFNANGIRARLPIVTQWLQKEAVDILCVQETKVQDKDFPVNAFSELGYHVAFKGQKSYNGVCIISKSTPLEVKTGFLEKGGISDQDEDRSESTRLIVNTFENLTIVNTYIPQGQDPQSDKFAYKLDWFDRLLNYFKDRFTPDKPLIWVGDFNVAPTALDVYDPEKLAGSIGFHPKEHEALKKVMDWGFVDVFRKHHPDEKAFTFWDYRIRGAVKNGLGWRIDFICATACMAQQSIDCWIDVEPRKLDKPSDHTFIVAEFK